LRAVAALCAKWDDRTRSFVRNDRIHAVVNFNLDALLREYVAVRYKRALVRSVERASKYHTRYWREGSDFTHLLASLDLDGWWTDERNTSIALAAQDCDSGRLNPSEVSCHLAAVLVLGSPARHVSRRHTSRSRSVKNPIEAFRTTRTVVPVTIPCV
jgi:hypothetical protein